MKIFKNFLNYFKNLFLREKIFFENSKDGAKNLIIFLILEIEKNKEKFDKNYKISYNINALVSNLNLVDNIFNDEREKGK